MNSLQKSVRMNTLCGFTLIELLIAMVIFAVLSVMAYGGLASAIKASGGVQARIVKLKQLERTFMHFERDIRQLVPRQVTTSDGGVKPALEAGLSGDALLEFTRGGNPNPTGVNRSSLFRVAYKLEEGGLKRYRQYEVDSAYLTEALYTSLLNEIDEVVFRFLDDKGKWQAEWGRGNVNKLPTAVEITLRHQKWGEIRRLIPVYGY